MAVYKNFILLVFNRKCMERNVMTSFRILSLFECFLHYFQTEWSVFFILHREFFTSCNVSNNTSLVSARTGEEGGGVGSTNQPNVDRPGQREGVPEISKLVRTSFMDDPYVKKFQWIWKYYNQFHNIMRLFDVLRNFSFTTSETMCDYYLYIWCIRVASRVAQRLKT